jgi:hypothetical protein
MLAWTAYRGLLLAEHDGRFQVNVNENDKLLFAWLEEEVLDVAE